VRASCRCSGSSLAPCPCCPRSRASSADERSRLPWPAPCLTRHGASAEQYGAALAALRACPQQRVRTFGIAARRSLAAQHREQRYRRGPHVTTDMGRRGVVHGIIEVLREPQHDEAPLLPAVALAVDVADDVVHALAARKTRDRALDRRRQACAQA